MSTYQPGDYEATRRRLTDALHTASQTIRNAQEVRDQAEEALDAFLDEHGTNAPMRIQVYGWPDGVSLEDVGDRAVDEETEHPGQWVVAERTVASRTYFETLPSAQSYCDGVVAAIEDQA